MAKTKSEIRSVQQKFFDILRWQLGMYVGHPSLPGVKNAELVLKEACGNTGSGFLQPFDSFTPLSVFEYSFQDEYAEFTINGRKYFAEFKKAGKLEEILNAIVAPLEGRTA